MTTAGILQQLDARIAPFGLLCHPFYKAGAALSRDDRSTPYMWLTSRHERRTRLELWRKQCPSGRVAKSSKLSN